MTATLLCVGHLLDDLRSLTAVAAQIKQQGRLEPIFLVTGPGVLRAQGEAYVRSAGFAVLELPFESSEGEQAKDPLERYWRLRRNNLKVVHQLLVQVKPAAILATVNTSRNLFLDEATRLGYPTILLQVALWGSGEFYDALHHEDLHWAEFNFSAEERRRRLWDRRIMRLFKMQARSGWQVKTTRIAVQGEYWRKLLLRERIPAGQITVTGNPSCDWAYEASQRSKAERAYIYPKLGLEVGAPFFLYCRENYNRLFGPPTPASRETPVEIVKALRAADEKMPIVVKLHPREGEDEVQILRAAVPDLIIVHDFPLMDLLAECSLCVSTISTTLVWAATVDRPTLSAFFWKTRAYYLKDMDWPGVERVFTAEDLTKAVRRYMTDEAYAETWRAKRANFVAEQMPLDGHCIERVVDLVNQVAVP